MALTSKIVTFNLITTSLTHKYIYMLNLTKDKIIYCSFYKKLTLTLRYDLEIMSAYLGEKKLNVINVHRMFNPKLIQTTNIEQNR